MNRRSYARDAAPLLSLALSFGCGATVAPTPVPATDATVAPSASPVEVPPTGELIDATDYSVRLPPDWKKEKLDGNKITATLERKDEFVIFVSTRTDNEGPRMLGLFASGMVRQNAEATEEVDDLEAGGGAGEQFNFRLRDKATFAPSIMRMGVVGNAAGMAECTVSSEEQLDQLAGTCATALAGLVIGPAAANVKPKKGEIVIRFENAALALPDTWTELGNSAILSTKDAKGNMVAWAIKLDGTMLKLPADQKPAQWMEYVMDDLASKKDTFATEKRAIPVPGGVGLEGLVAPQHRTTRIRLTRANGKLFIQRCSSTRAVMARRESDCDAIFDSLTAK